MICIDLSNPDAPKPHVMVVSENGYGKRSELDDYRITKRGGKGVKTINITGKTGRLIAVKDVSDDSDLMIINKSGVVIRLAVAEVRITGRAAQGVRLINLRNSDQIAAVCKVNKSEEKTADAPDDDAAAAE